jgi:ribosomal protein S18 acetylase RimI-like enzyme
MKISIRNACNQDIPEIMKIEEKVYGVAVTKETFEDLIKTFPLGFLVAEDTEDGRRVVGYVGFERTAKIDSIPYVHKVKEFHVENGENAYLEAFGVDIQYQNKQLGKLLYKKAMARSKQMGCKRFVVLCNKEDPEDQYEISLLQQLAFVEKEKVNWEICPGYNSPHSIWIKDL